MASKKTNKARLEFNSPIQPKYDHEDAAYDYLPEHSDWNRHPELLAVEDGMPIFDMGAITHGNLYFDVNGRRSEYKGEEDWRDDDEIDDY